MMPLRHLPTLLRHSCQPQPPCATLLSNYKRSQLMQLASDVVDKALAKEETIKVYTDALDGAHEKINQMVTYGASFVDTGDRSQIPSVVASGSVSCNYYNEPSQVRAKGCGKRLKGGKERALGKAKNSKARRCNGCGLIGQSTDKRNCSMIVNMSSTAILTPNESSDECYSSRGDSL